MTKATELSASTRTKTRHMKDLIRIRGARQNNLKNLNVDLVPGEMTVVTGLSGSGKSSLVFDTIYAEGQRRYVETFSPYARQFLDRMDHPQVDAIEGVPPAIAIDQTAVVRTSRSNVGTMTEINDHLKLLFAHHATLYCPHCATRVEETTPQSIYAHLKQWAQHSPEARLYITFRVQVPQTVPLQEAIDGLSAQGFTRIKATHETATGHTLDVVTDRFKASSLTRSRAIEAIETAMHKAKDDMVRVFVETDLDEQCHTFISGFSCAHCACRYSPARSADFSFNSPLGACERCKGFGRVIGLDRNLIIPDPTLSLAEGVVRPWRTDSNKEVRDDLFKYAARDHIPTDIPYNELSESEKKWLWDGEPGWDGHWTRQWYGINHYFEWLESKSYKMHIRVLLSRYRSYFTCPDCGGSHLKPLSLSWRYGSWEDRQHTLASLEAETVRFKPVNATYSDEQYDRLPGFNYHELCTMPLSALHPFFERLRPQARDDEALILDQLIAKLSYLNDVGLGYLTLDRQSRTLSGGEVQRVNLTTALGTSLVNTLFVLDEPSIGLHPRDMARVNQVMRKLRDADNTLLVVEHDPQVMLSADRLIDIGPKAGAQGGHIIYDGPTQKVLEAETLTAQYLAGKKRVTRQTLPVSEKTSFFEIRGVTLHNLKETTVKIPLGRMTALVGVSGAGKSTLINDVLVPAFERYKETRTYPEGLSFEGFFGTLPSDIVYVDQSPMGSTARGMPVTYVSAYNDIRKLFADSTEAKLSNLSASDFSFNTGEGRCPACNGSGFEHVEMQFLSDVYLPCPVCNGQRFQDKVLRVRITLNDGKLYNISEVLDLTVDDAVQVFAFAPNVVTALSYLKLCGLGYLKLGQSLSTLSGGERQRLKLAGHLASGLTRARGNNGTLFVFDEPTTGLHFQDIQVLMDVFSKLVSLGHSVLIVEHNLDVIANSDWLVELGPEGGDKGGKVTFEGTPEAIVAAQASSHTGAALSAWLNTLAGETSRASFFNFPPPKTRSEHLPHIDIMGAREHNLKNLNLAIPREQFTVITGPSGSGKSTIAFDIVFAEGQRRYLESLNAYARSMVQPPPLPDVDLVQGIPPTVAIEQRTSRGGLRSTVATMTELYHFLRLIYAKLGTQYCPDCHVPVSVAHANAVSEQMTHLIDTYVQKAPLYVYAPVVRNKKGTFKTLFTQLRQLSVKEAIVDGETVHLMEKLPALDRYSEHSIDALMGTITSREGKLNEEALSQILKLGNGSLIVRCAEHTFFLSEVNTCPECGRGFPALDPKQFSYNSPTGACSHCLGYGIITDAVRKAKRAEMQSQFIDEIKAPDESENPVCPACLGLRLNPTSLNVFWHNQSIAQIGRMSVEEALTFFSSLHLEDREKAIGQTAIDEIISRLRFLKQVGLKYLNLDRSAPTLSGGESQRIRLAAQLGSNLRGVCYVLDEPTIGLHPRDNKMLLDVIQQLTRQGNTLLVVEHDEDTIRAAEHIIDIGPGAGSQGGCLVAQGDIKTIERHPDSVTGRYLREPLVHTGHAEHPFNRENDPHLTLRQPNLNNLKIDHVDIPLGKLVVVTGVSGSGKSTLVREILYKNLAQNVTLKSGASPQWSHCDRIEGVEQVARVLQVDQTPIGKTSRSCPATYIGVFNHIRDLFAQHPDSLARGYNASRFSFNTEGGRCPVCLGQGVLTVEMNFLPDVKVECEACHGQRFDAETLSVAWQGKSIGDVLDMSVDEAYELFQNIPLIAHPLSLMQDVGLGYLRLGQHSSTLSGGEAQRIKLVTELAKVKPNTRSNATRKALYVLDEPTVGLHMNDVTKLIAVVKRLVNAGNTVVVVEHNLDMMAEADWIIDLGPEAGNEGGQIVGEGEPYQISQEKTMTGVALAEFLSHHQARKEPKRSRSSSSQ